MQKDDLSLLDEGQSIISKNGQKKNPQYQSETSESELSMAEINEEDAPNMYLSKYEKASILSSVKK